MPSVEKRRRADVVIDCSGTLEHTGAQVIALFTKLKGMEGAKSRDTRAGRLGTGGTSS
jgi:dephospho-CoA kinase